MADDAVICLITGANTGLGYATAAHLLTRRSPTTGKPYHILVGCRSYPDGQAAASSLSALPDLVPGAAATPLQIDVTSAASIEAAATRVRERFRGRLDVLVNNAGVVSQAPTRGERMRATFAVNVLGAVDVTEAFLPLLLRGAEDHQDGGASQEEEEKGKESPRLIFVGSSMGSLAGASDPSSRYYRAVTGNSPSEYRASKAALNMMMIEYHKHYGAPAINPGPNPLRVYTADPGPNATGFMAKTSDDRPAASQRALAMGVQAPSAGAKMIAACVVGERDGGEGRMWGAYGESPW
ncbi:putative carbonyl reductase [Xylariomycetidae sp. FL2044]|nr:putative carbonyl reductase [Xylariomycetidae sp. FL2044]